MHNVACDDLVLVTLETVRKESAVPDDATPDHVMALVQPLPSVYDKAEAFSTAKNVQFRGF